MPPRTKDAPATLKPYLSHGVNLDWGPDATNAVADCPFCGREGKFAVAIDTGLWRCLVCGDGSTKGGGNAYTFLRLIVEQLNHSIPDLAEHRGLLDATTLTAWRAGKNPLTDEWVLPAYNEDGKLSQLYRYVVGPEGRYVLLGTAGLNACLFGTHLFDPTKPEIWLCEGPWDAMALWEVLRCTRRTEDGYAFTANENKAMIASGNVLAVPGCTTFLTAWAPLFAGKVVHLLFDNDHPRPHPTDPTRKLTPVALTGMKKAAAILVAADPPPESIHYMSWGPDGYDPGLPSGSDVRDFLKEGITPAQRVGCLAELLTRIHPIPPDWVSGATVVAGRPTKLEVECLPCNEWKVLRTAWQKAMKFTAGLDRALSVMLASVLSTKSIGDQLWVKIVGPPASGKSTLCEAVSMNHKYVLAKSTIRGFHSGYQVDKEGKEDTSLIALARDKTLVVKDGDTLLQSPNLPQILAEARDVYDRVSRTHYRNKTSRDYGGVNMTWILCGTASLRALDSSELGERFLVSIIVESIDEELEDAVALQVAHRACRDLGTMASGSNHNTENPEMTLAKQLTGGYVSHLRENAQRLLDEVSFPTDELIACTRLAKFVAFLRARPSKTQEETAEREMSSRLTSQLVRLGKCLAVVLNRKVVDAEVMARVRAVALDTARGRTLKIAEWLYRSSDRGAALASLAAWMNTTPKKITDLVSFMGSIGAVELFTPRSRVSGYPGRPVWRLTPVMRKLYVDVVLDGVEEEAEDES